MKFKKGQLIVPRGKGNSKDLFEVICIEDQYVQAIGIKVKEFVRFPKTSRNFYRPAKDADIKSYIARHMKYHVIQNFSENGSYKLAKSFIDAI